MFGSYAWARQSGGGRMTPRERFVEMPHGIRALSADRLAGVGRLLGARPQAIRMALAELPVPQSPQLTAAEASRDEAKLHPETRIGFLCHRIGFLQLIADADRRFAQDRA